MIKADTQKKRLCERFVIFGATLRYRKVSFFAAPGPYSEDNYPVLDLSRGGLRFVSQHTMNPQSKIVVEVQGPGGETIVTLNGVVMWTGVNPGRSYPYQIGVQFNHYGRNKGDNPPEHLEKLIDLEKRYGSAAT